MIAQKTAQRNVQKKVQVKVQTKVLMIVWTACQILHVCAGAYTEVEALDEQRDR
jgi:hypothetical protein